MSEKSVLEIQHFHINSSNRRTSKTVADTTLCCLPISTNVIACRKMLYNNRWSPNYHEIAPFENNIYPQIQYRTYLQ